MHCLHLVSIPLMSASSRLGCHMQILEKLMASQQVHYDFDQYALPMKVDVPVTVLSVGASLLKASVDLEVPINAAGDVLSHVYGNAVECFMFQCPPMNAPHRYLTLMLFILPSRSSVHGGICSALVICI